MRVAVSALALDIVATPCLHPSPIYNDSFANIEVS